MDQTEKFNFYGFYRAKVIDDKDPEMFGRVMVWIPDIMPKLDPDSDGIWARPANNPVGGRNLEDNSLYYGTCLIPQKGSWIWIFFEKGNPSRPYYFAGLDLQNTKVLPECQTGSEHQRKWVVFKSKSGRCITISDDEDDCRVEITGKKRQLGNPPSGDIGSVFQIDGNQTVVLIDERSGSEKVMIKDYKGNTISLDTTRDDLYIKINRDIHIKAGRNIHIDADSEISILAHSNNVNIDGVNTLIDQKASKPAQPKTSR